MLIQRRALLRGMFAMPAIVAVRSLMPIRGVVMPIYGDVPTITIYDGPFDQRMLEEELKMCVRYYTKDWIADARL